MKDCFIIRDDIKRNERRVVSEKSIEGFFLSGRILP